MARRAQLNRWFLSLTVVSLAVSGCAGTSKTTVSTRNTGWMAAIKKRLSPKQEYATVIEEAPNREPSAKLFVAYGRLEESRNNLTKAVESYNKALHKNPESYNAILGLARIEQLAGRVDTAEQGFLRAKQIAPRSPVVLSALGQFYASQQRWDEAIDHHRQAFMLAPVDNTYRYELARVLTQAGRIDEGLTHFEKSGVGTAAAHYNVGVILHEQGQLAASEQHLLHATIHDPNMHQAQEWLDVVRRDKARQQAVADAGHAGGAIQQASGIQQTHRPSMGRQPIQQQQWRDSTPQPQFQPRAPQPGVPGRQQSAKATVMGVQSIPSTVPKRQ